MKSPVSPLLIPVLALALAGSAGAAGAPQPIPPPQGEVIVLKLVEGSGARLRQGELRSITGEESSLSQVTALLETWPGARLSRVFSRPEEDLERDLEEVRALGHEDVPDLNLFYHLRLPAGVESSLAIQQLLALGVVETAYPAPRGGPAVSLNQAYLDDPPGGTGMRSVWPRSGGKGAGITIADVEACWQFDHEDLSKVRADRLALYPGTSSVCSPQDALLYGINVDHLISHGTSVLGELVADSNTFGVTGMAHEANVILSPVQTCTRYLGVCLESTLIENAADAINRAFDRLQPGDVILIEWQVQKPGFSPGNDICTGQLGMVPVEYNIAEYAAIKFATSRGVIVVEAAGNGDQNLDDDGVFDRTTRDSGAILVGAGASSQASAPRSRLCFSNFGSRVDVQAWGEDIATTKGGNDYTTAFNGTSGASPMVAAAAAVVQAHRKATGQAVLSSADLRELLAGTGVPQEDSAEFPADDFPIGPQVNVKAAIDTLDTVPTVTGVTVNPALGCAGSASRQWLDLQGTGFVLASQVVLSDGTTEYPPIGAPRVEILSSTHLRVCAGVSFAPQWTARVKNLSYHTSMPFAFTVSGAGQVVTLTASPSTINPGGSATLTWSAPGATSCTASGGWSGARAASGSQSVAPSGTTIYTLTCTGPSGVGSDSETVTVTGGTEPPLVLIDALPEIIAPGATAGLAWASSGATSCTASGGWSGSRPLTGIEIVAPSSTRTYTLTCSGPGGSASDSQVVTVTSNPYVSLIVRPENILPGETATLYWSTAGVGSCTASGGWSGSKSTSGSQNVSPSSTQSYSLTCTETAGQVQELIQNGSFVNGSSNWSRTGNFYADSRFSSCKSCPGYAYLSASDGSLGASNNLVGWIRQDFSIPASASQVTLSFQLSISTQETSTSTVFDSLLVWLKDTSGNPIRNLVSLSNLDAGGYRPIFLNLNAERGRTVRLEFLGATDATLGTVFRIDDVSVQATLPGGQRSDGATLTVRTPPTPSVSLTATPDSVEPGQTASLGWTSSGVDTCTASGGWSGSKAVSGNQTVAPGSTTTYSLACTGPGGTATASVTVSVRPAAPSVSLTATPPSIQEGGSSTLAWTSSGATSCTAAGAWDGSRSLNGQETVAPVTTSTYVLVCQGPGGSRTRSATVTVAPHTVTITAGPAGSPNPVKSHGSVALTADAADSYGHGLTWSWFSSCPGTNGNFSNAASRTPTWAAPTNASGTPITCLVAVTATDSQGISATASYAQTVSPLPPPGPASDFWTVEPCRLLDTRNADGPTGGPLLTSGTERTFTLTGRCGIPSSAVALAVNVTAIGATGNGNFKIYPAGDGPTETSVINFAAGQVRANNAILPIAGDGTVGVLAQVAGNGTVHLVLDVSGYFDPAGSEPPGETIRVLSQGSPGQTGKDIWTTSVYSYDGVALTPGGGRDDEKLVVGGWGDEYRALLQFDLAGLPEQVSSVSLRLYALPSRSGETVRLFVDRLTADWDWRLQGTGRDRARLWWADRPGFSSLGDADAPTPGTWYSLDITALYRSWMSGEHPNFGLELRPQSIDNVWSEFASSQDSDPSHRPRLVITTP